MNSVSAVLVTRLVDLLVIISCGAAALQSVISPADAGLIWLMLGTALAILTAIGVLLSSSVSRGMKDRLMKWRAARFPIRELARIGQRLQGAIAPLVDRRRVVGISLFTILIWLGSYAVYWWIALSINVLFDLRETVLSLSMVLLLSALPFKGMLGLGTQEVGWVLSLTLVGWTPDNAITAGISLHIVLLSYTLLLGTLGLALLLTPRSVSQTANQQR